MFFLVTFQVRNSPVATPAPKELEREVSHRSTSSQLQFYIMEKKNGFQRTTTCNCHTLRHITITFQIIREKEHILNTSREKNKIKRSTIGMLSNLSTQ
jgi:hypothetical protein